MATLLTVDMKEFLQSGELCGEICTALEATFNDGEVSLNPVQTAGSSLQSLQLTKVRILEPLPGS